VTWPNAKIKEVALVVTGKTPSKKVSEYFGGDIPFVTPSELSQVYVETAPVTLTKLGAQTIKLVPTNSIMVCCIGSLGKTAIAARELATNQQINTVIFDNTRVFPKYGYYALQRLKPMMDHVAPSTTVAIINKSRFESFEIPLPPLEEQKRIAAILDKADAVRRKRQQAIELADKFLQSVFLDMFGDPVTNPKGWEELALEKVVEKVIDCPHSTPDWTTEGKIAVRTSNLTKGSWDWEDTRYVTHKEFEERSSRAHVNPGDIILSREGTIGIAAIVEDGMEICLGQRLVQLCPNTKITTSEYLLHFLLWKLEPSRISSAMQGATSKHLNVRELRQLLVPIPPTDQQEKFASISAKIKCIKALDHKAESTSVLFNSLSQQAFKGKLTKDEAA